ncbi:MULTISPECIES: dihydroorotate dehydrogenase electron transfer subunit [unclassified Clostridium]|uniref:dihydroorotate dehydrogenase electron transfer subunit n=1 Tax=unclassified Clostridium TaxID=2614128 RepID=UPI001896F5DC|nr:MULTISPECIES: dihydroorotate dehydrogenase electron transfer subunit [unclassified Clostridium]MCR1949518.1 dihydroorotate dehydrogenase electron transfer subunit [Clostridium sp. DSM 100503]
MKVTYSKSKVISNEKIVDGIYKMVVEDNNEVKPGQFYMLKLNGQTLLPRPISVCEKNEGTITFLYAVVGNGTREYTNLEKGEYINLTGPLGNGFNVYEKLGKVALVSGGIGTAPMLEVAKKIKENKNSSKLDLYAGFREDIYLIDEIKSYVDKAYVSTNSGKHGHKGFVTDILNVEDYDTVFCCGPEIMMKKVIDMCKEKNVKAYVSMEKHMACGVGACLVCTCKTKDGNKRTCKDGPVFDGYYVEL